MFNEDEIQTFYTGRKIRVNRANQEPRKVPREEPLGMRIQNAFEAGVRRRDVAEEESHSERRVSQNPVQQPNIHQHEEDRYSPLNRLIRAIQSNIDGTAGSGKQIIGVFGMDSDNLVIDAMNSIGNTFRTNANYYELPLVRLEGVMDVYSIFAASILNFCSNTLNHLNYNRNSYRSGYRNPDYALREVYVLLDEIQSSVANNDYDYDYGLARLKRVSDRMQRPERCQNVLRRVCDLLGGSNVKLIWKVEISMGMLSRESLEQFSKLACDNFIIIFNMLTPLNLEASVVASNAGYVENSSQSGHQILSKYIWFENLISCD